MTEFEKWEIAISVLSAVATFLAVCVALWQSKLQFKKKIHIAYNNNYGKIQENCYHPEYVEFLIFNASNIKVAISNIYLGKKCEYALSGIENDVLFQKPKILDIGETFSVIIKFNELINAIKYLAKKDERILNKKMVFVVEEISGKKFNKKIEHTYGDYLLWNDNKICLLPKLD